MSDRRIFSHDAFPVLAPVALRFTPGTRIGTPDGFRAIEALTVGDAVETRGGPRPVEAIDAVRRSRNEWAYDRNAWPIRIPVGSLGNAQPMRLSPEQHVLLTGGTVLRLCGREEVWVALGDLVGLRGLMTARPLADLRYHGLSFGTPEVIEAEGVPCAVGQPQEATVARDLARATFQAMHAAGEPPLKR